MTVLIIAEDAEFSRNVISRWQSERSVPTFTVASSTVWQSRPAVSGSNETASSGTRIPGEYDLVIIAPMPAMQVRQLMKALECSGAPVVVVAENLRLAHSWREEFPRVLPLPQEEDWLDLLILLAGEVLRRVEATLRARQAEESAAVANRHATLGRYMIEMRHSFNNALTSVLGHAELMLIEPGSLSAEVRAQIATIHNMALRMHEIMQRFSSLDTEMEFAEKQSQHETEFRVQAAANQS